jgi:hypothetical protein
MKVFFLYCLEYSFLFKNIKYFCPLLDFHFVLKGITRLLNNPLLQTYLPNSTKKVHFHQELLVFFWKLCDYNKKFLYFVLKSSDVLEVLVPILYHLNDSRADQCKKINYLYKYYF